MKTENQTNANLQRVSVIGTSCSGKTTFAKNLAEILSVKHIELDALSWLPDWVERPKDEFFDSAKKAADEEVWVFDGNYSRVRAMVWKRATTIIWLDYSFPRTFYRALNRTTRRVLTGETVCAGNRETFSKAFLSRDSILLWVLTTYHEKRRRYSKLLQESRLSGKEVIIFQHPRQAEKFLQQITLINR